jgi:hypothetical protein
MWECYPQSENFEVIIKSLTKKGWLTSDHPWNPERISEEHLERWRKGRTELEVFKPLSEVFNDILSCNISALRFKRW